MIPGRLLPVAPWALYALVLLASFYPESLHPARMILYVGDPLESAYLMAWHAHQVLRDPVHLFDANYLYPVKAALATTEHHLLQGLAFRRETWEIYYSTYHFKPIVHGYTAYPTRESIRLRDCALRVPDVEALRCHEAWRVDALMVHYPPPGTSRRQNRDPAELVGIPPRSFYRGIDAREAEGSLVRRASFEGPRSRIPGGQDIAFRIARPAAPGP